MPTNPPRLDSPRVGPVRAWSVLLGAGLGAALGAACTLQIEPRISCGDGYVDEDAGEECEPGVPSTYENACRDINRPYGTAACDPYECTIINDLAQCALCGDGFVDELFGEECDGDQLNGQSCQGGAGTLQCNACRLDYSACRSCGNGEIDAGEECDPNAPPDTLGSKPSCAMLDSPYGDALPYSSGLPGSCGEDCRWKRTTCGYCGNGSLETDGYVVDFDGSMALPERCDGQALDDDALEEAIADSTCTSTSADLRPVVECATNCRDFILVDLPQPCCYRADASCPTNDSLFRCCHELEHPEALEHCQYRFDIDGTPIANICR